MANSKAAKKYKLVSRKKHDRNQHFKTKLKSIVKRTKLNISNSAEKTIIDVREACQTLDRMVTKGILKKNTAARRKSRLMLAFNKSDAPKTFVEEKPKKTVAKKTTAKKTTATSEDAVDSKKKTVKKAATKISEPKKTEAVKKASAKKSDDIADELSENSTVKVS